MFFDFKRIRLLHFLIGNLTCFGADFESSSGPFLSTVAVLVDSRAFAFSQLYATLKGHIC